VPSRQHNFSAVYNAVLTPRLVNQLLAGVNYFFQAFDDSAHGQNLPALGFNMGVTNPSRFGSPNIEISGFDNGGVGETPRLGRKDTTGHLTENLSYTRGSHALKFGGEFRRALLESFTTGMPAAPSPSTARPAHGRTTRLLERLRERWPIFWLAMFLRRMR
jgi:hypothetical protein